MIVPTPPKPLIGHVITVTITGDPKGMTVEVTPAQGIDAHSMLLIADALDEVARTFRLDVANALGEK